MKDAARARAREIAANHLTRGEPLAWFEELYSAARVGEAEVPWADRRPNPHLVEWMEGRGADWGEGRALVVGCGLGDDAQFLSSKGLAVTAFDISPTAIGWCGERFADTRVDYRVANLLHAPGSWTGRYDLILESYTLQAMPEEVRRVAMTCIPPLLAPGGKMLLICRGREASDPAEEAPWPLTREEIYGFEEYGLTVREFEDFQDTDGEEAGSPPVRRFRVELVKES